MRVAVRTDATVEIGIGHVKRCLALAQALRAMGAELLFVMRPGDVDAAAMVAAEGFDSCALSVPAGDFAPAADDLSHAGWARVAWDADATETVAALSAWPPDWLIVDHYAFDARWQDAVRAGLGCRLAAVDDLADRPHSVDLLIDHGYAADHRAKYGAFAARVPRLLGGPHYALLGAVYADADRNPAAAPVRSVGVFMGGVDAFDFSATTIRALRDALGFDGDIEVASTSANPHLAPLRTLAAAQRVELLLDRPELSGFFARHELHVGAGGGATWERCCIGAPTLAIVTAANQRAVLKPLAELGVVEAFEPAADAAATLAVAIAHLIADDDRRQRLAASARRLVDGRGAARVAEAMSHV